MRTRTRPREDTDRAGTEGSVLTGGWGDTGRQAGVIAVAVQRVDRTCALFFRGSSGSWPSVDEAKASVEEVSAQVVWRETTPGVWAARVDVNEPPPLDHAPQRRRSPEPPRVAKSSTGTNTYMAALVLRGIVLKDHGVEPDSTTGSAA